MDSKERKLSIKTNQNKVHSHRSQSPAVLCLVLQLQVLRELPLIQAVLQRLQAHRRGRGAAEERSAPEARSPGHDSHQHAGGEPGQLGQSGVSAEGAGQRPRAATQGRPRVLQGKVVSGGVNKEVTRTRSGSERSGLVPNSEPGLFLLTAQSRLFVVIKTSTRKIYFRKDQTVTFGKDLCKYTR